MRKALDLRPLSFSDVMSRSFSLYAANFVGYLRWFMLMWLLPMVAVAGIFYFALDPYDWVGNPAREEPGILEPSRYAAYFWIVKIAAVVLAFTTGASGVYYLTARVYAGGNPGFSEVAQAVYTRFGHIFGAGFLHTLVLVGLTAFCWFTPILVGQSELEVGILLGLLLWLGWPVLMLWYLGVWGLTTPVVVLDDAQATEAYSRSGFLTKSWRMRLIGIFVTAALLAGAPGVPGLLSIPGILLAHLAAEHMGHLAAQMVSLFWAALLLPLFFVPVVIYYFDMRCRKEGYDLAVMALNFGIAEGELARYRFNPGLGYYPKGWKGERGRRQGVRRPAQRAPAQRHQNSGMAVAQPMPFGPQPGMTGGWPQQQPQQPPQQPWPPQQQWPQQPPQQPWPPQAPPNPNAPPLPPMNRPPQYPPRRS